MKGLFVFLAFCHVLFAQMYSPNMNAMPVYQQSYPQPIAYQQTPMPIASAPIVTNESTAKVECEHGACCSSTKTFLPTGEPCRATTNPCEEVARCNGNSAECPENPKKSNGSACMMHGQCTDGYCTEYECVGLCCVEGLPASEGTPCGPTSEGGKCVMGTCTVYRKVDPHVTPLTDEEKEIISEARKEVKGEIEGLLRSHARYLIRKVQFDEMAQKSALENLEGVVGTNVTGVVKSLASGNGDSASGLSWSGVTVIVGLVLIAVAVVIIFVVKPKERMQKNAKPSPSHRAPKKRSKEDMSSADYDPPAF